MSNLIQNPGFENVVGNDFAFWTEVGTVVDNTTDPYSGSHAAQLGTVIPPVSVGSISQTFNGLIPGKSYTFSFYAASFNVIGIMNVTILSLLSVIMLDTTTLVSILTGPGGYTQYTYQFTAWDTDAILSFTNIGTNIGVSALLLDDVSITLDVVCYSGDTLIYARDNITGQIDYMKASDLFSQRHSVFSTVTNEFIPIVYNIVSGPSKNMRVIKKDALGPNMPTHDLVITSGHTLIHNGELVKVRDLKEARRYRLKKEIDLYSICVKDNQPILVAGLDITAWGHQEWLDRLSKSSVTWHDNKREKSVSNTC